MATQSTTRRVGLALVVCLLWNRPLLSAADPESPSGTTEFLNQNLRQNWADNEVSPAEQASDAEWGRRVYLDLAGRIPTRDEAEQWLDNNSPRKRMELVELLLESSDYVRHFTTIWTNLCIGRGTPRRVSRRGMEKFFREAFARNRPWNEVAVDLITAEGHFEENGAVNYILAQTQMQDEGVQLTASAARLLLGLQLQCTQCHDHPFNDWRQNQFWEFNSFFRQVRRVDHRRQDPDSGRVVDDYSEVVRRPFSEGVFYEKRSGLMQVAFPGLQGQSTDPASEDRRGDLAQLLLKSEGTQTPQLATAFVNRMWAHFLGYGLTRPVDDLGPHNPPSHPELLERLATDFVASGYDVKQLIRWITATDAYSLSSRVPDEETLDRPQDGEMPLFSYAYVRSMQAEQLYDSLIVATQAHRSGQGGWQAQEARRRQWMQQFVVAFDNDENDEATTFNGTIPQAMMLMNSELTRDALQTTSGSLLHTLLNNTDKDNQRVQQLYLATLSRRATRGELNRVRRLFRQYGSSGRPQAYQDLLWALLNSNEFILIH